MNRNTKYVFTNAMPSYLSRSSNSYSATAVFLLELFFLLDMRMYVVNQWRIRQTLDVKTGRSVSDSEHIASRCWGHASRPPSIVCPLYQLLPTHATIALTAAITTAAVIATTVATETTTIGITTPASWCYRLTSKSLSIEQNHWRAPIFYTRIHSIYFYATST